ncbi:hypothetical protein [Planktothricoides raciborskii]|uniref:hypothetical protein n=1 Tax=Planktothricoides raciborskii TaxID=132608 RepID=UPI00168275ED|nr:hypothetical protein [Planktothricoides raciborskii]
MPQDAIAPSFFLSPKQETGFLMCLAQICGEFREETRFLISQEKRDRSTKKPGFLCFLPNFWRIPRRNPVSHVPRCDRPTKKPGF